MTATVIIDDISESAIIDVEIRPEGTPSPAVAFNLDETGQVVRIAIGIDDEISRHVAL